MPGEGEVRTSEVAAQFRHSAGALGSRFLAALRDERRILGWRSGTPARVTVPPRNLGGTGGWVDAGTEAVLEAYAPNDWLATLGRLVEAESCLALVRLRGADEAMLARLRSGGEAPKPGQALIARFAEEPAGSIRDLWFEPA